jgi:hypothetical protein
MFLTAPDASFDQAIEELDKFTIDDLIKEIKAKIVQRSANGIRGISRIFKIMDDKGDRKLDVDDFRWGLIDFGIQISKGEAVQVLQHFDRDGDGYVNFDEFLVALRVSLLLTYFYLGTNKPCSPIVDHQSLQQARRQWRRPCKIGRYRSNLRCI